ncbi:MAG: alpha/beta hydrolase [Planctomycetota bacterium]
MALWAIALLVVTLVTGYFWTRALIAEAERKFPPLGDHVEVDGLRLHYLDRGQGPPLVLLHGAFGAIHDWQATVLPDLEGRFRVIAIDRPGHGYSQRPAESADDPRVQARLVRDLVRKLGIEQPLIAGFSWGATTALTWALEYPDEIGGLVLVNGAYYPWPGGTSILFWVPAIPGLGPLLANTVTMPIGTWLAPKSVERAFLPGQPTLTFRESSPVALAIRPESYIANAADMRHLEDFVRELSPRWPEIEVPVEVVCGEGDQIAGPDIHSRKLADVLPNSRLTVVPRAGHQLPYSHPGVVLEAIDSCQRRIDEAR